MGATADSVPLKVRDFLHGLFFGLDKEELDQLSRTAQVRRLPAGSVICREGEPGDAFYVVDTVKRAVLEVGSSCSSLFGRGPAALPWPDRSERWPGSMGLQFY